MWQTISESLSTYSVKLIAMAGSINPYVGAAVALLIGILLIYAGFKAKAEKWMGDKEKSGEQISKGTSDSQNTAKGVNDKGDDFLDKDGKK